MAAESRRVLSSIAVESLRKLSQNADSMQIELSGTMMREGGSNAAGDSC